MLVAHEEGRVRAEQTDFQVRRRCGKGGATSRKDWGLKKRRDSNPSEAGQLNRARLSIRATKFHSSTIVLFTRLLFLVLQSRLSEQTKQKGLNGKGKCRPKTAIIGRLKT